MGRPIRIAQERRLLSPHRMAMDFRAKRVLFAVLILFVLAVALQINGSSIGVWRDVLQDGTSPAGVIFSKAKSVRSDEWMAWTPSILARLFTGRRSQQKTQTSARARVRS